MHHRQSRHSRRLLRRRSRRGLIHLELSPPLYLLPAIQDGGRDGGHVCGGGGSEDDLQLGISAAVGVADLRACGTQQG